ncbi:hypothetical protein AB6A40_006041 [Gnathostoma spinigerum]|uniref:Reticulon-like protein n=1 Tax=Gnathostoma spinigerum TaxID=75299 RepID=A0ABD6EJE4_9BILA
MSLSIFLWTFTNGYLYGLILSLILAQLFINYMQTQRGITLGIVFWPVHDDQLKIFQLNNTEIMFEAIQWLQSVMKTLTGFLEAVNSLILWRHPAATEKFVIFIVILLWMTFVWPTNECLKIIASITITNAFFVVYLYQRFPRLRQEIDHLLKFYSQKACRRPTETECLLHSSSKSASLMHSFDEKAECRERSGQSADDYHASIPVDDSIWRTINDTQYSVKLRGRKNGICYTNEERCNFIRTEKRKALSRDIKVGSTAGRVWKSRKRWEHIVEKTGTATQSSRTPKLHGLYE